MMRRLGALVMAFVAGAFLLAACSSGSGGKTLGVDEFADLVATDGVVLIDVRTPEEFATGHLAGAQNIDVESSDFTTQIANLDTATTYAVYCRSGNRSLTAMTAMQDAGFENVSDLSGGITAWAQAGQPVVTD
ncbi:MAG: rhodanese-like domain-containing protein [Actinobacteria bacterium]|nr:rhodanese-like domain-containing protein [Actinomycetota bacterium]MCG2799335.1 rhodanese-like domain-containing protein [Cellulomonas sp.]